MTVVGTDDSDEDFLARVENLAGMGAPMWGWEVRRLKRLADWAETPGVEGDPLAFVVPDRGEALRAVYAARKRLGIRAPGAPEAGEGPAPHGWDTLENVR